MHKLSIDYLGPIKHCEIEIENFSVFTGAQASGKSSIAKTVFYFRTIKNDFYEVLIRRMYHPEFSDDNTTSEKLNGMQINEVIFMIYLVFTWNA